MSATGWRLSNGSAVTASGGPAGSLGAAAVRAPADTSRPQVQPALILILAFWNQNVSRLEHDGGGGESFMRQR